MRHSVCIFFAFFGIFRKQQTCIFIFTREKNEKDDVGGTILLVNAVTILRLSCSSDKTMFFSNHSGVFFFITFTLESSNKYLLVEEGKEEKWLVLLLFTHRSGDGFFRINYVKFTIKNATLLVSIIAFA